jgi:mRNA interferase MazF
MLKPVLMPKDCKRGAVVSVVLDPSVGREMAKTRPCVVVQSDLLNRHAPFTVVVPVTGAENIKRAGPTLVAIKRDEAGLEKDSFAVCHQIRIVDETRLGAVWGHLKPATLSGISEALKIVLDL